MSKYEYQDEFAQKLVTLVRDEAIRDCDSSLLPQFGGPRARRWQALVEAGDTRELLRTVIPDCVDNTIACLLDMIESGQFKLFYKADDGSLIDLEENGGGEMVGWYGGVESWRERFSSERFIGYTDDHPELSCD